MSTEFYTTVIGQMPGKTKRQEKIFVILNRELLANWLHRKHCHVVWAAGSVRAVHAYTAFREVETAQFTSERLFRLPRSV
jgi:hypothetical protein